MFSSYIYFAIQYATYYYFFRFVFVLVIVLI